MIRRLLRKLRAWQDLRARKARGAFFVCYCDPPFSLRTDVDRVWLERDEEQESNHRVAKLRAEGKL